MAGARYMPLRMGARWHVWDRTKHTATFRDTGAGADPSTHGGLVVALGLAETMNEVDAAEQEKEKADARESEEHEGKELADIPA
jgi:hypothetical protein